MMKSASFAKLAKLRRKSALLLFYQSQDILSNKRTQHGQIKMRK